MTAMRFMKSMEVATGTTESAIVAMKVVLGIVVTHDTIIRHSETDAVGMGKKKSQLVRCEYKIV